MDIYIVARKVGELWVPTATCHRDYESAREQGLEISRLYPQETFSILTGSLSSFKAV